MNATTHRDKWATSLLHLYPATWRERYEDEMLSVLEERPATWRTLFSLGLGVLDAYLHTNFLVARKYPLETGLRNSQIQIFACCFLFLAPIIFLGFYNVNYQMNYTGPYWPEVADLSPLRWLPHSLRYFTGDTVLELVKVPTIWCLVLAFLAIACAAAIFVFQAVRQVLRHPRRLLTRMLLVWVSSVVVLAVSLLVYDWLLWRTFYNPSQFFFRSFLFHNTLLGVPQWVSNYFTTSYIDSSGHILVVPAYLPAGWVAIQIMLVWNAALLLLLVVRGVNSVRQNLAALRYASRLAQVVTVALCAVLVLRLCVSIALPLSEPWWNWSSAVFSYLNLLWLAMLTVLALFAQRRARSLQRQLTPGYK